MFNKIKGVMRILASAENWNVPAGMTNAEFLSMNAAPSDPVLTVQHLSTMLVSAPQPTEPVVKETIPVPIVVTDAELQQTILAALPFFPGSAEHFQFALQETAMSVKSVLAVIGSDVKKVFSWLGSPVGQQTIATGEAIVESVYPPADGIIVLANAALKEIIKIEGMAAAAGVQAGSGVQKSAAVINTLTPEILAYAQQFGFAAPTAAKIQEATNALVAFLNAFEATA